MEVVKITRKVYKCLNVTDKPFTKFSKFREIRERLGMKFQRCCFNCNHKFTDDDDMYLAMFKGTLNHFLCKKCRDIAMNDLRKEETK